MCALAACESSFTDLGAVIALQVFIPDSGAVEVGDTVQPRANALNGYGDTVAAEIFWGALDTATVEVLDSTTGWTRGKVLGEGRIQARVGSLRSSPLPIRVQSPADSIRAENLELRDTVDLAAGDSLSDTLTVRVFATPSTATNQLGRRVEFTATIYPAAGTMVTFQPGDTVLTNTGGIALARLRLASGQPDSVVVTATARRADGQAAPGSPVTFVVEFRP